MVLVDSEFMEYDRFITLFVRQLSEMDRNDAIMSECPK